MTVTERHRIDLLEAAQRHLGREVAVTLMEMLPPTGWGDVATRQRVDALEARLTREMDLRFQVVDQRFATFEARIDATIDGVESGLGARIDALDAKIDALGSRLDAKIDALGSRLDTRIDALDAKIDGVESRLDAKLGARIDTLHAELRADIAASQRHLIQWMVGTMIALTGVAAAAIGAITQLG